MGFGVTIIALLLCCSTTINVNSSQRCTRTKLARMPPRKTKKTRIAHADIVRRFADRLKERRSALGLTQAEVAKRADVTVNYVGRLEGAGAAPGIDLLERLAKALETTVADLLPGDLPPDQDEVLRKEARRLFEALIASADRSTLQLLVPLLARMSDHPVGER